MLDKPNRRVYFLFVSSLVANFLVSFNNMSMNVALPSLVRIFDITYNTAQWSITVFVLAMCFTMPIAPYLSRIMGTSRALFIGMCIFTVGTIIGSLASQEFSMLILARFIMGLAGGLLIPVSMMIVYEIFPSNKRGAMMGVWGIVVSIAPALGPPFSSVMLGVFSSYNSLFYINFPFLIIMFLLYRGYKSNHKKRASFDALEYLLLVLGLISFLYGTTELSRSVFSGLSLMGAGVVSLLAYIWRTFKVDEPILSIDVFKVPVFAYSQALVAIATFSQYSILVLVPIIIVEYMNLSEVYAGFFMVPYALISGYFMSIGGKQLDKKGAVPTIKKGIIIMTLGSLMIGVFTSLIPLFIIGVLVHAIGWGLMSMPSTTAGLNGLHAERVSDGSSFSNLWRQMFRALSVVILIQMYEMMKDLNLFGISILFVLFSILYFISTIVVNKVDRPLAMEKVG
ncbi:MFS transporter [Shouchella miscanthi]|uniref:MFS transporter n=1 Tax=Shouchella miscanthi TaxID=2598861 RepID=A0ABU6NRG6_9BACI|nr:MFS transporter [Shouchella miscanthi]MED4130174.1 MFS transporter [Shouchella miscanthi]